VINHNALILLIDTYDTAQIGIINAITAFQQCGIDNSYTGIFGIRIDSGDLAYLSKFCRQKLDQAGKICFLVNKKVFRAFA
jgi:nicotinate phosphoribosyltransferase